MVVNIRPIKVDLSIPNFAFTHLNQEITLQAIITTTSTQANYHQFC